MKKSNIIATKSGKLQGYISCSLQVFKGIPYACSPIDELRFKPPIEIGQWEELLDATRYGPYAPQAASILTSMVGNPGPQSEDNCLTLNIWTPGTDDKKRPVMVWIHGGGFVIGSGNRDIYDGSFLAEKGDVVVVTINYRLGPFGFLYIPDVTVNAGFIDQITALKWIHDNIEIFGGNSNDVTIFSQSAGALSAMTLIAMPDARKLFHRVICQSVHAFDPKPPVKSTQDLFQELGIPKGNLEALSKKPTEQVLEARRKCFLKSMETQSYEITDFRPCIDGETLPLHPFKAIQDGAGKDIDLLIGNTLNETKAYNTFSPFYQNLDDDGLEDALTNRLGKLNINQGQVNHLVKIYKKIKHSKAPPDIYTDIDTDFTYRIPTIRYAEAQSIHNPNTYSYLFNWKSPKYNASIHALDLPFTFGTLTNFDIPEKDMMYGTGQAASTLSEKMMISWIAFSRNGSPNNGSIPSWPRFELDKRSTMIITKEFRVENAPFEEERVAWDEIPFY